MSTRDREPDPSGPLKYAPKWARMAGREEAARREHPRRTPELVSVRAASPQPPSRPRELPPWKLAKPRGVFEGDVAIRELRERLAQAPNVPPSPPIRMERGPVRGIIGRLAGLVTVAAIAAYAFVWISTPRPPVEERASAASEPVVGGDRADRADAARGAGEEGVSPAAFRPDPAPLSGVAPSPPSEKESPFEAPPPGPAGPWPDRRGDVAPMTQIPTTGTAVPFPAVAGAQRSAGPASASGTPGRDREEVAALIARGQTYLASGDVVSARLVFRRAAEAGDAQAALAVGGTFDPVVLKSLGVIGVAADLAQARNWYQRAALLGSREAPQRLDQLAQSAR